MRRAGIVERRLGAQPNSLRRGGGAPAAFNPLTIPGGVAWFDMLDPSSFVQAGTVTAITNKASGVVWTEPTFPPDYDATGLNGKPCMVFGGLATVQRIISAEAAVWGAVRDALPYTLVYVAAHVTLDLAEGVFGVGNSGVATNQTKFWGQFTTGSGRWFCRTINDATTIADATSAGDSDTDPHVFRWNSPGTTVSSDRDNGAADPSGAAQNPGTLTPNQTALGCRPDNNPDNFFDGMLGELILYNNNISAANYGLLVAYLNAKWGL